ncbi:hypothetical protein B0A63_25155 [Flavobacterium johnsoniae UW101]|uniref:Uncharacterized protein n=2 Tax=Flavobacterium johnsoniae TaxID=986 RepID=A5FDL4_FLAJ1|nr:hypothetical protein Fjoh_3695 [Flavobacterium johnsoniae UW101]OXE95265.1 hypothetical protein B0A63_25155 [Flavobacterium johnsoniae UW101]
MNNIQMKTIIIEKNKKYFKRIAIILLMIFVLCGLVIFLRYPSEHTYFLLPTKNAVIIFSIVGIITCALIIFLLIKSIFRKDIFLRIDQQGIFNGFFLYSKKLIKWEEISKIETIKYNYNNYIAIFLKETPNNEKGISSLFFKMNEKSMGTPYIITSGDLDCSFDELERLILESYNQSKQIKN